MQRIIKKRGISKSKWIADLIKEKAATSWPENVVSLAGAWADISSAEEMRKEIGRDAPRESV
jgi:hypothetical protein